MHINLPYLLFLIKRNLFTCSMRIEEVIKYPKLSYLRESPYNGRELLGKLIFFEEKRDGSNIRCFIDENDNLQFGSRNKIPASDDLIKSIKNTGYDSILRTALYTEKYLWNHDVIVFFELLQKGKSPSRIEYHEKDDIAVFDIYDINEGWWNYTRIYQFCYQWKLPVVKLWAVSSYSTTEKLEKQIEKMLDRAKKENREGVVFKSYDSGKAYFFKDRLDTPHKKDIEINIDTPKYPELPRAEVMNEIQRVLDEIGLERFRDKKIAMPLIAQYVAAEAKARMCSVPKELFSYYLQKLRSLKME